MKPLVLHTLSYGVYALGVKDGGRPSACIVTSVMQITPAMPAAAPLVAVSLHNGSYSCDCVDKEGLFTLSVFSEETPAAVVGALGYVSGRQADKLANVRHKVLVEGVPVIKEKTCCWFLCRVVEKLTVGGQTLFVAEIIAGSDEAVGTPMTYQYLTGHMMGGASVDSPLYLTRELTGEGSGGESFVCSVCGYVYSDPNFGFEELPADWTCPICKMPKKAFVRK